MPTMGTRIKEAREARRWSQRELAARADVTNSAVSQWESDRNAPSSANLVMLSELLGVTLFGAGDLQGRGRVPVVDPRGATSVLAIVRLDFFATIEPTRAPRGPAFAFYMPDRGMAPRIDKGELVIVDCGAKVEPSSCVAIATGGDVTVRRLRIGEPSHFRPDNADYPVVSWASGTVLGVVVETRRLID